MSLEQKVLPAEDKLVMQLRQRDQSALAALYDHYSAALFGVILKIVKDEAQAEDVLQDGMIRIWNSFESYDAQKGRLFTWMLNICRNLAIDHTRSRHYRMQLKRESIDTGSLDYRPAGQSTNIIPEHIGLKEITTQLKPEQKELIDLLYFDGFTQTEAAEKLMLPLGTVKTRVRAAIKKLSQLLS